MIDGLVKLPGRSPNGAPVFGTQGDSLLRPGEFENLPHQAQYRVRKLRLWVEAELGEYVEIMERATNQAIIVRVNDRRYSEQHESFWVWIEYAEFYAITPAGAELIRAGREAAMTPPAAPAEASHGGGNAQRTGIRIR